MLNSKADGSVTIDTTIDTEGLSKAIDRMNKVVDGFVKKVSGGLGTIDKGVDKTAQKSKKLKIEPTTEGIDEAVRQLDNLNARIEIQEQELGNYQREYQRLSERFGSTSTQALAMQKKILSAESALAKMTKTSDELADEIRDAENAMKDGASSMADYNRNLEQSEDSSEKAASGSQTFQTALGHLVARGIEKAVSGLISLIDKTKELRGDMSKLEQNAQDAGASMEVVDDAMRSLNAVTGETDSNIEAVSNLLAAGFKDNNLQEAVDTLSGAVIKFPDTIKIESLADSLQETLATKEATGQFAEVLGRVGINVDTYNKRIAKMSEEQARNYTIQQLQKKGLMDVNEEWRKNHKEMIEAADAAYDLQNTQAELAATMDPIRTKILVSLNKLLSENKETIQSLIQTVGNVIEFLIRAVDTVSQIPAPILLIGVAITAVVLAIGKFSVGAMIASSALAAVSGKMAAAAPAAAAAGSSFALLSLEIAGVAAAIALVVAAIASLINAIANLVSASKGIPSSIPVPSGNLTGYAVGTVAARRGLALVGERGPELVNFRGGEQVYNATQTAAMRSLATSGGATYQDNRQYIFKVDDIATYVAIEKRVKNQRQSQRMGYVGGY